MKTKLEETENYAIFIENEEQRPIAQSHVRKLTLSMQKNGFIPSKPLQVYREGRKLIVVDGHHRLYAAKSLGLKIPYVVEPKKSQETMADINAKVKGWKVGDFVQLYAARGDENYQELTRYNDAGIPFNLGAGILMGNTGSSTSVSNSIKSGHFQITTRDSMTVLLGLIHNFSEQYPAVGKRSFISAIASCLATPEFDANRFHKGLQMSGTKIEDAANRLQMMEQIETVYNYNQRKKVPLAFIVNEFMKSKKEAQAA